MRKGNYFSNINLSPHVKMSPLNLAISCNHCYKHLPNTNILHGVIIHILQIDHKVITLHLLQNYINKCTTICHKISDTIEIRKM